MARKYPNDFTPDGVDIETAFANDDLELKDILSQIANVGAINLSGEKRQSVLSAHVDSSGNPDYITATGLNVSIDGSATPVILAFAAGFDDKGSVDLVDAIKTNVSAWTVPSNATVYLYVDKDASTGLLSYGYSTLPDLYQKAAPTAVLDQHWYDTNACKMKRYNGSAWEEKRRVFVGKVVAGASTAVVTIYPIRSSVPSNSDSATKLQTSRKINGVDFDGSKDINIMSTVSSFKNLKIKVTSNTVAAITADLVSLLDSFNQSIVVGSINLTISSTNTGVNGLDTGTVASSTWYSVWLIAKADGTTSCLLSTSETSPTLPTDYIYKSRIGWLRTDSNGNLRKTLQTGKTVLYAETYQVMASGNTSGYVSVSTSSFVPATASHINLSTYCAANAIVIVASSSLLLPIITLYTNLTTHVSSSVFLESTNIYYSSSNGGTSNVSCLGWEDNL